MNSCRSHLLVNLYYSVQKKLRHLKYSGTITLELLPRLFEHLNTLTELKEVYLDAKLLDQNCEVVSLKLPSSIERLSLFLDAPFEFCSEVPGSLKFLEVNEFYRFPLQFPNLDEFMSRAVTTLPTYLLDPLETCLTLELFCMTFRPTSMPSASYVQDLLRTLSKLTHLRKISVNFDSCHIGKQKMIEGSVVINQSDFSTVKDFSCKLPVDVTFYSLDIFDSIEFHGSDEVFIPVENIPRVVLASDNARFSFEHLYMYTITIPNASCLSRLTSMKISADFPEETVEIFKQLPWITSLPSLFGQTL